MRIAEMCVVGNSAIYVPQPLASEDHQTVNAMTLVNKKAALIVPDTKAKSELFPCLLNLVNDEKLMKELTENISKMSNTNADEIIAEEILKQIK
jgi:UDP-N-acetylglucosamine--N-acetylmuramyl-(pentapeptide) pyrophosphoryl-undecaprenol N-acetylglucosamine transferase